MSGLMKFGSVSSGIEAASVAWHPLGWKAAWLSEIAPFPSAVLKHHYPDVPNLGDMTLLPERILSGEIEAPDLFCGGTPCQSFSVAGLRKSLDDARGNLSLTFCEIANAIDKVRSVRGLDQSIVFWENVPGVLSTKDNAFGCFLAGLAGEDNPLEPPRGKWTNSGYVLGPKRAVAWRVLDAQYFGVAQRRKRVFVVASARADFDPAAVLFEFDGLRRDTAPSREKGESVAGTFKACASSGGWSNSADHAAAGYMQPVECEAMISLCLNAGGMNRLDAESETLLPCVAPTIEAVDGRKWGSNQWVNNGKAIVCIQDVTPREKAQNGKGWNDDGVSYTVDVAATQGIVSGMAVRRLTPIECERLQGFPDDYTNIKDKCPDGPRYKALGNSWAVPVVRWIGKRIANEVA